MKEQAVILVPLISRFSCFLFQKGSAAKFDLCIIFLGKVKDLFLFQRSLYCLFKTSSEWLKGYYKILNLNVLNVKIIPTWSRKCLFFWLTCNCHINLVKTEKLQGFFYITCFASFSMLNWGSSDSLILQIQKHCLNFLAAVKFFCFEIWNNLALRCFLNHSSKYIFFLKR